MDHAAAEDLAEDLRHRRPELVEVDIPADLACDRCYPLAPEPARNDQVEAGEVGVDVEGEAVGGHPLLDADADRPELAVADPGAGHALHPAGLDPEAGRGADHHL